MRITDLLLARKVAELTLKHSNLPESFIKQCTEVIEYESPKTPSYRNITVKKYKDFYSLYRPWTNEFQLSNYPVMKAKKVWVEPVKDWHFFRGDRVEILTGRDKGKQGIINYIVQERNWVLVSGLNLRMMDTGSKKLPKIQKEAPLLINKEVALVDPVDLKPTKVEWRYDENGNRVRVSLSSGRILPIPEMEEETYDYKMKKSYVEQPKDTREDELTQITFIPCLKTFEMDIMDEYSIGESRVPAKSYWY